MMVRFLAILYILGATVSLSGFVWVLASEIFDASQIALTILCPLAYFKSMRAFQKLKP